MNEHLEQRARDYIETHLMESKKSAFHIQDRLLHSELNAGHNNVTRTLHVPKFFSQEDKARFEQIVDTLMPIFYKTIEAFRQDPAVRQLFPFDRRLEQLILLPPDQAYPIPICRIDIFYDEKTGDFKFCEFNTDGTSAMNENFRLTEFLDASNVMAALDPDVEVMELMESWIDALLEVYRSSRLYEKTGRKQPAIVITDFLDKAYISEFYQFEKRMRRRGLTAEVADIRDLAYENGRLIHKKTGTAFDLVYRRAVTRDIMEDFDHVQPFVQAIKDGSVVCAGPLSTQIVHHKAITRALTNPVLTQYFTPEENAFLKAHMPETLVLNEENALQALADKDRWILKPDDSYASKGVYCGLDLKPDQWKRVISECTGRGYLMQEYVQPYQSPNIDLINFDEFRDYTNMTGLYVYNGQFAGVYSRLSDSHVISTQYNEKAIPTLFVKE